MNKDEARPILLRKLVEYHRRPYEWLAERAGETDRFETTGRSGAWYQIEIELRWDDRPGGVVRVLGSIDDAGWSAFCPMSFDFLASPDHAGRPSRPQTLA